MDIGDEREGERGGQTLTEDLKSVRWLCHCAFDVLSVLAHSEFLAFLQQEMLLILEATGLVR